MNESARPAGYRKYLVKVVLLAGLGGIVAVANLPVTTRQGINYEVSTHRLPLYVKGIEFLDRHVQYRQIAGEVTRGLATDEARMLAVYDWTVRNLRPTPDDWLVVDDHILNIVIRRHGTRDQFADVFATIATYGGVPAFWQKTRARGTGDGVILSFARVDGRWVVLDVANHFVFRNGFGRLATAEDLAAHPELLPAEARALTVGATRYADVFVGLRTPPIPNPLRAELQMPGLRLWDETLRAVGLRHDRGPEL